MKSLIFIILTLFILCGCTSEVKNNLNLIEYEEKIVVNGALAPNSVPTINLSRSKGILANTNYIGVNDATVIIQEEDINYLLEKSENGNYVGNFQIKPNTEYNLIVNTGIHDEITASNKTTNPVNFYSTNVIDSLTLSDDSSIVSQASISFIDDKNEINYYELLVYQIIDEEIVFLPIHSNNSSIKTISENELNSNLNNYSDHLLFTDNLFNGNLFNLKANFHKKTPNNKIIIHLKSISEEYFNFLVSKNKAKITKSDPFSEPINVTSNISGGLGIFVGYTYVEDTI